MKEIIADAFGALLYGLAAGLVLCIVAVSTGLFMAALIRLLLAKLL